MLFIIPYKHKTKWNFLIDLRTGGSVPLLATCLLYSPHCPQPLQSSQLSPDKVLKLPSQIWNFASAVFPFAPWFSYPGCLRFSAAACEVLSFSALSPLSLSSFARVIQGYLFSKTAQFVLFLCILLILFLISFPSLPVQLFHSHPIPILVKWTQFSACSHSIRTSIIVHITFCLWVLY